MSKPKSPVPAFDVAESVQSGVSQVMSVHPWSDNGALIADVARLHYIQGDVLDATYGRGTFWNVWRPESLTTNDADSSLDADFSFDFRDMHYFDDESFTTVVFDPPYKLNGTPALGDFDARYGIDKPMSWQARMQMILDGAKECARVSSRWLLVKCQDQIVSGKTRWQTTLITEVAEEWGFGLVDRFDLVSYRPQPRGRGQVHARHNASQLLVFRRNHNWRP